MMLPNWLSIVQAVLRRSSSVSRRKRTGSVFGRSKIAARIIERLESRQLLTGIIQVTTSSDDVAHSGVSLRDAVTQANTDGSGDTITFANSLAGQTILLTQGELKITGSMTISGLGASQLTIDGNNASRIFDIYKVTAIPAVTITGLTLQHGNGVGLKNSGIGGAISNSGVLVLANDTITGNLADSGGGIANSRTLTSTNNSISGNSANDGGGGIYNIARFSSMNDSIYGNTSQSFGGGIANNGGTLTATNDVITGNMAEDNGGGIFNNAGNLTATNVTITGNSSKFGGGIFNLSTMTATNNTIVGNVAQDGGGIYDHITELTAANNLVIGNTATSNSDLSGSLTSSSINNLIGIPSGLSLSDILQTDMGGQPLLANNGGPTQTIALSNYALNPAIGMGVVLTTVVAGGDAGTTLTVDSTEFLAVGSSLRFGTEIVTVIAIPDATTLTVLRAQAGTTQTSLNGMTGILAFDQRGANRNPIADLGAFETQVPTISNVTIASGMYTASAFTVTNATVTGFMNQIIATFGDPSLSYTYYSGTLLASDLATATPLSGAPINVGNYTVVANYASSVGYENATSAPVYFSITPAVLTISAVTNVKVYDGTKSASALPLVIGLLGSDKVTGLSEQYTAYSALGANNSVLRVNPGFIVIDGNGGANYNVALPIPFALGTITPAALTIAPRVQSKVYDGTTDAFGPPVAISGLIPGDILTGTAAYTSKDVMGPNGSTLYLTSYAVGDGNGGNNYTISVQTSMGTITPAKLTIAAVTNTKVYDGTKSAAATPIVTGLASGDSVSSLTESYTAYSALGTNNSVLRVDPGYVINDGNGGANYNVALPIPFALGTITPAALTIAPKVQSKVYDGTTAAFGPPVALSGLIPGDILTGTAAYTSKDVMGPNGSTLYLTSYAVGDGNGGNNYTISVQTSMGTITPAKLTIAAVTNTKVYDGTKSAAAIPIVTGLASGDSVAPLTESYTAYSALGTNNSVLRVDPGYVINDGNGGANYNVSVPFALGTITPANLTIAAVTNTKVYDGTKSAAAIPTVTGLVPGDFVTGLAESYTAYSALGTNNSVLRVNPGYTIGDGNGGANYNVILPFALGTITPAALTIAPKVQSKVYDGTTAAFGPPVALSGLIPGDILTGTAAYTSKDVMGPNGSTLYLTSYAIGDGNGGNNYAVTVQTSMGTITPAKLTIAAVTNTKVYDGTKSAAAIPIVTGLASGDSVAPLTESYTAYSALGTNNSVLRVDPGYVINDGNGGANYNVSVPFALGTITPADLIIAAVTNTKVYDGTKSAAAIPTVTGLVPGDYVTGLTEQYTAYSALGANNSVLRVDPGYTIGDGNGGANYNVILPFALGTITPAALTIAPKMQSKVYDGTTAAFGPPVALSGLIPGDILTGTAAYTSKDVMGPNGSTLFLTSYAVGDGNGGNNYTITVQTSMGTIIPAMLRLAAVTDTKVYDGTKYSGATPTVAGLASGDSISPLTQSFTAYSALGTDNSVLRVNPGYMVMDGNGGANYIVMETSASGTITPAALTISAVTLTKVYDGTTTANVRPIVVGLVPGESVTNLSEQFTSPFPAGVDGSTLLVDPGYIIGDGNGGNNYVVTVNSASGTILSP